MIRVRIPARQEFSVLYSVQTGSGAHTASYVLGEMGFIILKTFSTSGCISAAYDSVFQTVA
jgi:hypothetical protein